MPLGAALTDDDVAGDHFLAAELLHATVLCIGVAPVARGAYAFLMSHCILSSPASAERDVVDTDFGEALTMSLLFRVVLPATELEDDDLLAEPVLDDLRGHRGALQHRNAGFDVRAVGAKEDFVELDLRASIAEHRRDAERLARLGAELLAAGLDDCV
jgi:hypothetical protein